MPYVLVQCTCYDITYNFAPFRVHMLDCRVYRFTGSRVLRNFADKLETKKQYNKTGSKWRLAKCSKFKQK